MRRIIDLITFCGFISNISIFAFAETPAKIFIAASTSIGMEADPRPISITKDQQCDLYAIVVMQEGSKKTYFGDAKSLIIQGQKIPLKPFPQKNSWTLSWLKVEPLMYHIDGQGHDPANPGFLWYTNAGAPGGKTDRNPLPPDTIKFRSHVMPNLRNQWTIKADAHPTDSIYDRYGGLGTMRYAIKLKENNGSGELRTPTLENYKFEDSGDKAYRVIVRQDKTYIGYLTGFFNVPGVFGSYSHQVTNHIGVDCADLIVGAWNEFRKTNYEYTNVTGLRYGLVSARKLELIQSDVYLDTQGQMYRKYDPAALKLSENVVLALASEAVHIGDIVLFNYVPDKKDRSWDHVGVLVEDKSENGPPNGQFDKWDLILHTGPAEPHIDQLGSPGFTGYGEPVRLAIVRWVM